MTVDTSSSSLAPTTHSTTDSASLRSLSGAPSEKGSVATLDLLSSSKVEASVSETRNDTQDGKYIRSTGSGSASQSLANIMRKSSNASVATSAAKSCDNKSTAVVDKDSTASDSIPAPSATMTTVSPSAQPAECSETLSTAASPTQPTSTIPAEPTQQREQAAGELPQETSENVDRRSSLYALATWWSGSNTTNAAVSSPHEHEKRSTQLDDSKTDSPSQAPNDATREPDTAGNMEWEPSGPEATFLQGTSTPTANHDPHPQSSSLPSSLPSSAAFPASMIKHTRLAASVRERRGSTSSTQSSLTSMLWSKLAASQDNIPATETPAPTTVASSSPATEHISPIPSTGEAMDTDQAPVSELTIAPTSGRAPDSPATTSRKRWSLFSYGIKTDDESESRAGKLRKSGDVLIEPESRPASVKEIEVVATSAAPSPLRSQAATQALESTSGSRTSTESTGHTATIALKTEEAEVDAQGGPTAPALVGISQLNIDVLPGTNSSGAVKDSSANATGTVSSSTYSWLSIIPGYGNAGTVSKEDPQQDSQEMDLKEQDRDGGKTSASLSEKQNAEQTLAQLADATDAKEVAGTKPDVREGRHSRQTFAQLKERDQSNGIVKDAGKAVASLSKVILKKKNVVLPDYYEQYPEVRPSLLTVSIGQGDVSVQESGHQRSPSIVKSAVNVLSSLLFSKARTEHPSSPKEEVLHRGAKGIKKVAIIGVHGWFPVKLIRTVIGEPTGTSIKFCDEMNLALKDYLRHNDVELDSEDITLIPLEGEGKVLDRVEDEAWKSAVHEADLVLVATHSQGTPTSTFLVARLIEEGILRVQEDDPHMQRVGILAMAGISHGPFPFLKGNLIVRWFEAEAAQELFEFMDSETPIAKKYREALRTVLTSGVRYTCVASLEDQVVPLYSAIMTAIHHPSIVRAVYIDGATYQDDFITNLISFSLRLRNSGVDDHGVLVHLSEVVAGSIYGEGHSTIYEEREVYMLAIRSLLEPPTTLTSELARSEPILHPFRAKHTLNPFYLPWGMRGVMDEIKARGDEVLNEELERLKRLYDEWNPVSKGMKEIKFRLEPLVGHAGIGKRRLAACIRTEVTPPPALAEQADSIRNPPSNTDIRFRTAETLPLDISSASDSTTSSTLPLLRKSDQASSIPETTVEPGTRYDLILLMVNMTNRVSWDECKRSLLHLDAGWFLGRCAIVVTQVCAVSKYDFDRDDITEFLDEFYDVPTIWTNLDQDEEATLAAAQVIRMLEIGAGYRLRKKPSSLRPTLSPELSGTGTFSAQGPTRTASLAGESTIGSRTTATHLMMKSPDRYTVQVTTLLEEAPADSAEDL
ncbi:hypothetical protein BGZ70_003688 [Mortierella alpina]|uniref:YMC020W-like alpha/beta hydrolase domain-containing protein n=1 Tax=Mortierella alpina TaxID=64518 RepID=A0A9P6JAJ7_MORAP|nr:hypothetical protein BGZ70_003688 [Mortierella alpina]